MDALVVDLAAAGGLARDAVGGKAGVRAALDAEITGTVAPAVHDEDVVAA